MDLTKFNFEPSSVADFMQTATIDIGDELQLCVEVGGNPDNPPLLLIMGAWLSARVLAPMILSKH